MHHNDAVSEPLKPGSPEEEHFREEMQAVGRRIDPASAEVFFIYADVSDPYGVYDHNDPAWLEYGGCVGRVFFAVDPASDALAVSFRDLPEETRRALAKKRAVADRQGWEEIFEGLRQAEAGEADREGQVDSG